MFKVHRKNKCKTEIKDKVDLVDFGTTRYRIWFDGRAEYLVNIFCFLNNKKKNKN